MILVARVHLVNAPRKSAMAKPREDEDNLSANG